MGESSVQTLHLFYHNNIVLIPNGVHIMHRGKFLFGLGTKSSKFCK